MGKTYQTHKIGDTEYKAGDCVLVLGDSKEITRVGIPQPFYIARIIHFSKNKKTVKAKINWYFWPEETRFGRKPFYGDKEVLESTKETHICVESISGKCNVHELISLSNVEVDDEDYYCRFRYIGNEMRLAGGGVIEDMPVYCICEQPYNPDKKMVECHICKDWFHFTCIGVKTDELNCTSDFTCEECKA